MDGFKIKLVLRNFLIFVILLFIPFTSFAQFTYTQSYKGIDCGASGECPPKKTGIHPFFAVLGGYAYTHIGDDQTVEVNSILFNYTADSDVQSKPFGGVTAGAELYIFDTMGLQVGLAYYQPAPFNAGGTINVGLDTSHVIIPFAGPGKKEGEEPLDYSYKITTRQAMLECKLIFDIISAYQPYIGLGIGESFNTSYDYDTSVPNTPLFENNVSHSFAYSGSAGVDYAFNPHIRLGIGYRYVNLGDADLGEGDLKGQETSNLAMSNFHTQSWFMEATFVM